MKEENIVTVLMKNASSTENIEKSLTIFVEAIELSSDLEIIGTALPNSEEVFVIRDYSKTEGIEGAYVEVSIDEIVQKVTDTDKAQEFINVIQNVRKPIVLEGITRIVGYYSRMSNWNKSKVGELRDRHSKNYALGGQSPVFEEERDTFVDNL